MLTGKNTSNPDFISALIDEHYAVLRTAEAQNAIRTLSGWHHATWNVDNNFIAIEDSVSGEILLLAVNDTDSPLEEDENYIYFPGRYFSDYSVEHIAGFECDSSSPYPELNLDFADMPGYTASLYLFEFEGD